MVITPEPLNETSIRRRGEQTARRPRVLLADDDDDTRAFVGAALRADGYDVVEASTGAELLDIVASSMLFRETWPPPDVIVSDIRMPGFTGTGVLTGLRAADWETPFILMTAFGGEEVRREAKNSRADALFMKPFDVDDLLTVIYNLVPPRRLPVKARERRESRPT